MILSAAAQFGRLERDQAGPQRLGGNAWPSSKEAGRPVEVFSLKPPLSDSVVLMTILLRIHRILLREG